jgi:hypothetical protein
VSDEPKLSPDDPTPDPEGESPHKGTTFVDVVAAGKAAAAKIDTSDGVDADEIVDAAVEGAAKVVPLSHHTISEIRRLLVPIITAIIAALAGGGFVEWRAGEAKDGAIREAEIRAEERTKAAEELDRLRLEIRKAILRDASWDDVSKSLMVDEGKLLSDYEGRPDALDPDVLADLIHDEVENVQAQIELPTRAAPVPAAPR